MTRYVKIIYENGEEFEAPLKQEHEHDTDTEDNIKNAWKKGLREFYLIKNDSEELTFSIDWKKVSVVLFETK
jgi:hypothetical protein